MSKSQSTDQEFFPTNELDIDVQILNMIEFIEEIDPNITSKTLESDAGRNALLKKISNYQKNQENRKKFYNPALIEAINVYCCVTIEEGYDIFMAEYRKYEQDKDKNIDITLPIELNEPDSKRYLEYLAKNNKVSKLLQNIRGHLSKAETETEISQNLLAHLKQESGLDSQKLESIIDNINDLHNNKNNLSKKEYKDKVSRISSVLEVRFEDVEQLIEKLTKVNNISQKLIIANQKAKNVDIVKKSNTGSNWGLGTKVTATLAVGIGALSLFTPAGAQTTILPAFACNVTSLDGADFDAEFNAPLSNLSVNTMSDIANNSIGRLNFGGNDYLVKTFNIDTAKANAFNTYKKIFEDTKSKSSTPQEQDIIDSFHKQLAIFINPAISIINNESCEVTILQALKTYSADHVSDDTMISFKDLFTEIVGEDINQFLDKQDPSAKLKSLCAGENETLPSNLDDVATPDCPSTTTQNTSKSTISFVQPSTSTVTTVDSSDISTTDKENIQTSKVTSQAQSATDANGTSKTELSSQSKAGIGTGVGSILTFSTICTILLAMYKKKNKTEPNTDIELREVKLERQVSTDVGAQDRSSIMQQKPKVTTVISANTSHFGI